MGRYLGFTIFILWELIWYQTATCRFVDPHLILCCTLKCTFLPPYYFSLQTISLSQANRQGTQSTNYLSGACGHLKEHPPGQRPAPPGTQGKRTMALLDLTNAGRLPDRICHPKQPLPSQSQSSTTSYSSQHSNQAPSTTQRMTYASLASFSYSELVNTPTTTPITVEEPLN